jgi:alpha-galactosidase
VALGSRAYDYILGLYEVLGRIFGPRPQILLESCSSGGNRFDLGMLCYSPQIWASDDTDPIERLAIQRGLSYLYPQSTFGAHVSAAPHSMTLRNTPLTTRGNVSFFGCLGYELDLKTLLPVEEQEIAAQIGFCKACRETFQFGTFRRLWSQEGEAWQVSGSGKVIAGLFHRLNHAAPGYEQLRLAGLEPGKRYTLRSREQLLRVGLYGGLVRHILPVSLNPNGVVLRTADRHYPMKDGLEQMSASGAALMSGVMLHPRFTGAGYDPASRNQGDFCSNVYLITEE